MKILFYVQRIDDAHLAHALALQMQQDLQASDFAAINFRRKPECQYLRENASLFSNYLSETLMHQKADKRPLSELDADYLDRLEPTYGLPFWHYVTQNRFLIMKRANYLFEYGTNYSRERLLMHVQTRFQMIEAFLDDFKPDIVVYTGVDVGPSSALVLEQVAKARNIPLFVPISTKIGSYHAITDTIYNRVTKIEQRFKELESGKLSQNTEQAKDLIAKFKQGQVILPYVDGLELGNFGKKLKLEKLSDKIKGILFRRIDKGLFQKKHGDLYNLSQWEYDLFRLGIEYRNMRLRFGKFFSKPQKDEKFVFFPFHVEPELALLLYAPYRILQSEIAHNVAQSLPWDTCLYTKDHPQGIGKKNLGFYKKLVSLPNVKMLYPDLNSHAIISESLGVVTITGTAAMEAMLLGKPAVTIGEVFFNFAEGLVSRAKSVEDLPELISEFKDFKPKPDKLHNFVMAILDNSVNVDPEGLAKSLMTMPIEEKLTDTSFQVYAGFLIRNIKDRLAQRY
ncbi:MAG TPA: hypothetical protein ENK21_08255 [Trueperaceae bacterium]|nr:hypothetical protein [Trueperaceae bacterium]